MINAIGEEIDPLGWARKPKSTYALQAVIDTAKSGDERFVTIFEKLVRDGVCTEAGKLLNLWDGQRWVRLVERRYRDAA